MSCTCAGPPLSPAFKVAPMTLVYRKPPIGEARSECSWGSHAGHPECEAVRLGGLEAPCSIEDSIPHLRWLRCGEAETYSGDRTKWV